MLGHVKAFKPRLGGHFVSYGIKLEWGLCIAKLGTVGFSLYFFLWLNILIIIKSYIFYVNALVFKGE